MTKNEKPCKHCGSLVHEGVSSMIAELEAKLKDERAISEGRRNVLFEKAEALRLMDRRAEAAEAELGYVNGLLEKLRTLARVRSNGDILNAVSKVRDVVIACAAKGCSICSR